MSAGIESIMPVDPFYLGDYVVDDYGRRGRIYTIHTRCPEDEMWLAGQSRPFTQEEIDGRHEVDGKVHYWRWLSVLVEGGGAIVTTEMRVERIEPFPLKNNWERYHFRDVVGSL